MKERRAFSISGWVIFTAIITLSVLLGMYGYWNKLWEILDSPQGDPYVLVVLGGGFFGILMLLFGLFTVQPNEAIIFQFFGHYVGTVNGEGLRWTIPLIFRKKRVSKRLRNFESAKIKVNDANGNPIQVAAIVEWRVVDTAKALFEVNDYISFIQIQSEAALRALVMQYPYECFDRNKIALMTHTTEIVSELKRNMQERFDKIGIEVISAQIGTLTYSPEIANLMLQRQQAKAVVAARTEIVDGAVGMVDLALKKLAAKNLVQMSTEQKAQMVSNLLVVLCSDKQTQPTLDLKTE